MANYTYSSEILDAALYSANEPTDGTSDYETKALEELNRVYQATWNGGAELNPDIDESWWWLRSSSPGTIILNPLINTGSVSVANNSASITFSSGPTPSVAGRHFKVEGHADVFRISAHTAGETSATLDSVYTGETDTAASFKVMQFEYDLASDAMNIIGPMRAYQSGRVHVDGMELEALDEQYPLRNPLSGVPHAFAMISQSRVRVSHYGGLSSTKLIRLDYEYMAMPSDLTDSASEEPLVPREHRRILADYTAMFLLIHKEDTKYMQFAELARAGLEAMAKENRRRMSQMSKSMGAIFTRPKQYTYDRNRIRTESGLLVW